MMTFNAKDRNQKQFFPHVRMGHSKENDHGANADTGQNPTETEWIHLFKRIPYVSGSADRERMHNIA
jgi:hypothetical protein